MEGMSGKIRCPLYDSTLVIKETVSERQKCMYCHPKGHHLHDERKTELKGKGIDKGTNG